MFIIIENYLKQVYIKYKHREFLNLELKYDGAYGAISSQQFV